MSMEVSRGRRKARGGEFEEENILAIVDASGAKHTKDANDDRIAFLEAVRAVSILSENGSPPTEKMNQEVFKILRIGKTLELIMASYQLLAELDKSFPRVYLAKADQLQSGTDAIPELVVVKEAWSPFVPMLEFSSSPREAGKDKGGPIDSYGFHLLVQELVELADETNFQKSDIESLRKLLLFQYLVNVLEDDFVPRNSAYSGTMEWNLLRESLLNMLLGSRKINYKNLMKDCITIMCRLYQIFAAFTDDLIPQESTLGESAKSSNTSVIIALLEVGMNVCIAMQKFLTMIMELDTSKKKAELEGCTTRADGIRTPVLELILDELTYNSDILQPFLQVYYEPKWKLELVVQYLWKYIAKPSVRTRRSNSPEDDMTFRGALKCLLNISTTRSTIKKIGTEVIQLLLVHGFQAYMSLPPPKDSDISTSSGSDESTSYSLIEVCKDVISAFKSLRETDKNMEILSCGKEALFTAATIISVKS